MTHVLNHHQVVITTVAIILFLLNLCDAIYIHIYTLNFNFATIFLLFVSFADPAMFRQLCPSGVVAQKRKFGESSGSTPASKVTKTTPTAETIEQPPLAIPRFAPASLPPTASSVTTGRSNVIDSLIASQDWGKGVMDFVAQLGSTHKIFGTLPRQSLEMVLRNGVADIMRVNNLPHGAYTFTLFTPL